jgi:HEAT repeat protein
MVSDSTVSHYRPYHPSQRMQAALDALYSPVARERYEAIQTLIGIGAPAVAGLLNALDHTDAGVRDAAGRALQGIGRPAVKPLAERLLSHKAHVREAAATALKNIGDRDAAEALRDLLYRELEDSRYKHRRWLLRKVALLAALGGSFAWCLLHLHEQFVAGPLAMALTASFADTSARLRQEAVAALCRQDARMVGPLAICLSDNDRGVRRMAAEGLQYLLPQVRAGDAQYLSPPEMEALLRALGGRNDRLIAAILTALAQIGDARALPPVEGLVLHGRTMEVRRAARECLSYLQLRAAEAQQAQTLLRAACVETVEIGVAADLLLRAASATEQAPPEQLLRSL